jgi:hypothetical protein
MTEVSEVRAGSTKPRIERRSDPSPADLSLAMNAAASQWSRSVRIMSNVAPELTEPSTPFYT